MSRRRIVEVVLAVIAFVVVAAIAFVFVVTNTDWGREKVRQYAQKAIQGAAHQGIVRIGKIEGNLLTGFTLIDVSITDSAKVPLVVADSASVRYALKDLYHKKIVLRDVRLVNPLIVLAQYDSGSWNYKQIFKSTKPKAAADTNPHFGSWISLRDVDLVNGTMIVRARWHPKDTLAGAARDSAIRVALTGAHGYRFNVIQVGDTSFRRVSEFRDIYGHFPLIRLKDPEVKTGRVEIDSLRMVAQPFRPPVIGVRNAEGAFEFNGDSVWWHDVRAELAHSTVAASGFYGFEGNNVSLLLRGSPVALADVRFVEPNLPSEGEGTLDFSMRWTDTTETYLARNAEMHIPRGDSASALDDTRLAGDFGITFFDNGDSLRFHDVNAQIANLDVAFAERIFPWFQSPWRGTLGGRAKVTGPLGALALDADVTLDSPSAGHNEVAAVGMVGWNTTTKSLTARNLRVKLSPARVALAKAFTPSVPLGGVVTGTATLDGSTASTLRATLDLRHDDAGRVSRVSGRGAVRLARGGAPWIDFDGRVSPLSLAEVGSLAPTIGLRGVARGPVRVTGTLADLRLDTRLAVSGGGRIAARGTLDLASREKAYNIDTRMWLFDANAVLDRAPRTSLTARAFARGRGFSPSTLRAVLGIDLAASTFDTLSVDTAHVRLAIADGLATVDTAVVGASGANAMVAGTFGLAEGHPGELTYQVSVDSLQTLRRFVPGGDTAMVRPRPRVAARRLARARRDSAAVAAQSEVARAAVRGIAAASRAPSEVKLAVDTPTAVRADSLAGSVRAAGTVRGWLKDFDVRGRLGATDLVALGSSAKSLRAEYAWLHAPSATGAIAVAANVDSVFAKGFAIDSATVRGTYEDKHGTIALDVMQEEGHSYTAGGEYVLHTGHSELHLRDLVLRFDSTQWTARHPAAIRWGGEGIEVDTLDLTNGGIGRIYVDGRYATDAPSDLDVAIDNFQVGDLAAVLQSDLQAKGLVSLRATLSGPAKRPRLRGAFGVLQGTYNAQPLPDTRGTFRYANERLVANAEATARTDSGRVTLVTADASVPLNLATGATGPRLPTDAPIDVHVQGDSLPIGLAEQFTTAVTNVSGRAAGDVRIRGTIDHPAIAGALRLARGTVRIVPVGVLLRDVAASVRIAGDTVVVDSIVGNSGGRILVRGGLGIAQLTKPSFDLYLVAENARVMDNDRALVRADAGLAVKGPFDHVYVSGRIGVRSGVVYIPEPTGKQVISADDPALFAVIDTALTANKELLPGQSPLLENLRVDVTVGVARDTWARSSDANVEFFTPPGEDLVVHIDRARQALTLEGAVSTDRGDYQFMSRRFQIRQGTATFIGAAGLDPTLQITAFNEVRVPNREALDIRVVIGGTLSAPRLSLDSDAQPPLSQSDLLSFIAFGRQSSALLQFGGSSIGGSSSGTNSVATAGATFLGQQLAGVALGTFVNEFEGQASRSIGADVFNITTADVSPEVLRSATGITGFLKATEVEVGKYTDPRTYIAIDARPSIFASDPSNRAVPGLTLQRRSGKGFRFEASYQPRFLLQPPTLEEQNARSTGVFGMFLIREWRF